MKIFKIAKRWYKNICWLLNHPPTNYTSTDEILYCDYCHTKNDFIISYYGFSTYRICQGCIKKVYDLILKDECKEDKGLSKI